MMKPEDFGLESVRPVTLITIKDMPHSCFKVSAGLSNAVRIA